MKHNKTLFAVLLAGAAVTNAEANCSFGPGTPHEPSLQEVFDSALGNGVIDTENDCIADGSDALWTAPGGAKFVIAAEIAGFASSNVFGLYDPTNPDRRLTVFGGSNDAGDSAVLSIASTAGGWLFSIVNGSAKKTAVFGSSVFGLFLSTPQHNTFFSDTSLNADHSDHMYAYDDIAAFIKACFDGTPILVGPDSVLLAFEDLEHGDRDYQDMVLAASGLTPVPVPAALWLLASGLLGLFTTRSRRKAL